MSAGHSPLASADRSPLVPTAAAFVGGGDWYRSTVLRDASEVCHAARRSRYGHPEGDHGDRRAAAARQLRHQRSRGRPRLRCPHAGRTLGPAIDRGRRGCSWTTSLGRRADRLARQGVPRRRDAAARRCRGGVERLPAPGPPSDRRTARCKCGRACRCGCECRTLPRPSPTRTRRSSPTVARNSGISRRSSGAREAAAPVRPSPLATDPRWHRTPRFPPCPGPELQPVCPWQRMVRS